MEIKNTSPHISHQFNEQMDNLRNMVMRMGGLVEQQIASSITALQNMDVASSEKIIRDDHLVNAMEVSIDEECTRVLARRQPAASDLRMVVAIIKTITDLERIGDEAEKIARMTIRLSENDSHFRTRYAGIHHLGEYVGTMVREALDSFARLDVDAALKVMRNDKQADAEYQALIRQLITYMMEDPRNISEVLDIVWAARSLERIGDHAKNISEYVIYLVKGKDIRHTDIEVIEKDILS
jgi:phosphate transport system protein